MDMIVKLLLDLEWCHPTGHRVIGQQRICHFPNRIDRPTLLEMTADGFIEELRHPGIRRFERVMQDHQSLAGGVALAQSGQMALRSVGVGSVAVNDERVRSGGFCGIRRPADADFGGDAQTAGIEVLGKQLATGRMFVLSGAVAFGAGDEQHRYLCGSVRAKQQGKK